MTQICNNKNCLAKVEFFCEQNLEPHHFLFTVHLFMVDPQHLQCLHFFSRIFMITAWHINQLCVVCLNFISTFIETTNTRNDYALCMHQCVTQ